MADAGFYRGTSSEQDSRFTDKERKLLKQMRFEGALDEKICMDRVNLDVLKPWITAKLNNILGMEDDVLIEYVFSQLEEKTLNPKVMQINLTGFLNARRAREFMGELWSLLLEAQKSEDGIPIFMIEQKIKELQDKEKHTEAKSVSANGNEIESTADLDWKDRYESLTGKRFNAKDKEHGEENVRDRDKTLEKESEKKRLYDEERPKETSKYDKEKENGRGRDEGRGKERERVERHGREDVSRRRSSRSPKRKSNSSRDRVDRRRTARSRSPKRSPPRRRFTERKDEGESRRDRIMDERRRSKKDRPSSSDSEAEKKRKKKRKSKRQSESESDHEIEIVRKKRSKRRSGEPDSERVSEKKRKKRKREKRRKHSSDSD